MQVTIEDLGSVKKKLNFAIPAERVKSEIEKAYTSIQKKAVIKGFRKGKAPRAHLEKYYGATMEEDVVKNLFQQTYYQALTEHKVAAVSYPTVDFGELAGDKEFTYSATVEVVPTVTVNDYEGLEVKKEAYRFSEEAVNARLDEMRESVAELVTLEEERPVASGDFVIMDFAGSMNGVPLDQGSATDFQLEIGSNRFIPGFEEKLIGSPVGVEQTFSIPFPENYSVAELAGKETDFTVTVKEIKVKHLPELNDEFAAQFGEYETLDALKTALAEMQDKQNRDRIETDFKDRLIEALIAKNDFEIPEAMVDQQVEQMLQNAKRRLSGQHMTLEMMGMDEDRYKTLFRPIAASQVKGGLLLEALAKQVNIEVSDEELAAKIQTIAGENEENLQRMETYYTQNQEARHNLIAYIREEKSLNFLIDRANVLEVPAEELKAQEN